MVTFRSFVQSKSANNIRGTGETKAAILHASSSVSPVTNHRKNLLVNVQFLINFLSLPSTPNACQKHQELDPVNSCQMPFRNLHSKQILYCCFLNFFHTQCHFASIVPHPSRSQLTWLKKIICQDPESVQNTRVVLCGRTG